MRIKICGVTAPDEAVLAAELGATHIGLNFYPPSPRYLRHEQARRISCALRALPSPPVLVGVFVNESAERMRAALQAYALDLAQLSGDEPEDTLAALGSRAYKVYRLSNIAASEAEPPTDQPLSRSPVLRSPALLLDAHAPGLYGGTGKTVDWDRAAQLARRCDVLLAGGLTPANVGEAIRRARPWGVDAASGVERAPGVKDGDKMRAFIEIALAAAPGRGPAPEPGGHADHTHIAA